MMCGNTYIKSKLRYESLKTLNHTHTHTHTYIESFKEIGSIYSRKIRKANEHISLEPRQSFPLFLVMGLASAVPHIFRNRERFYCRKMFFLFRSGKKGLAIGNG